MALDKSTLKNSLKSIMESQGNTPESVAEALANAIDTYVKGAVVTVTALPSEVAVTSVSFGPSANASPLTFKGGDANHVGGLS